MNRIFIHLSYSILVILNAGEVQASCKPMEIPKHLFSYTVEHLATSGSWDVLKDETAPKVCWISSSPILSSVGVYETFGELCRGSMSLAVTFKPSEKSLPELSFRSGYEFAPKTKVSFKIDKKQFFLPTVADQFAWAANNDNDQKIIDTLQQGKFVELFAVASNGTEIHDRFSLDGFSAALVEARQSCLGPVEENFARLSADVFQKKLEVNRP